MLLNLRCNEWVILVDDARMWICQEEKENNDELIKIDQDLLDKLMADPILSKLWVFVISIIFSIAKGRVTYLLVSSDPSKFLRNNVRQFITKQQILNSDSRSRERSQEKINMN